jgi:hypothetical protein
MPRSEAMSKYGNNGRLAIKQPEPSTLIEPDIFGPSQLTMLPLTAVYLVFGSTGRRTK